MKNKLTRIFIFICTLILLLCFSFGVLACGGNSPDNEPTNGGNNVVGDGSIGDENNDDENNDDENNDDENNNDENNNDENNDDENNDDENNNDENNNEGNENQTEIIEGFADCSGFYYDEEEEYFTGITFNYEDKNVVFECSTNKGGFMFAYKGDVIWPSEIEVENNGTINWSALNQLTPTFYDSVYIDVILKVNGQIKGYELLELYANEQGGYKAKIILTKLLTIDEQQEITEEKVRELLDAKKDPEKTMNDCIDFYYHLGLSFWREIKLLYNDQNAIFKCKTDKGFFAKGGWEYAKEIEVQANDSFIWAPKYDELEHYFNDVDYIDAILMVDGQIKGYTVIKLYSDDSGIYYANTLKAEIFTEEELNGEQMTEEKVQELIAQCKGG